MKPAPRRTAAGMRNRQTGISVLVADPQRLVAESLGRVLRLFEDLDVVGERPLTGADAVTAILTHRPQVSLIDYRMPDLDGPEITRRARTVWPEAKIILMSWFHGPQEIENTLDSGAVGFLTKSLSVEVVAEGIRRAAAGESPVYLRELEQLFGDLSKRADRSAATLEELSVLSRRELEVLALLSLDHSVKEVAAGLKLSPATVKMYIRNMLKKTGALSAQEVLAKARSSGLIRT